MRSAPHLLALGLWLLGPSMLRAAAAPADLQERRSQLRRLSLQQQAQLEQRLRCLEQASSSADLDRCESRYGPSWHHARDGSADRGGWGCPMW